MAGLIKDKFTSTCWFAFEAPRHQDRPFIVVTVTVTLRRNIEINGEDMGLHIVEHRMRCNFRRNT